MLLLPSLIHLFFRHHFPSSKANIEAKNLQQFFFLREAEGRTEEHCHQQESFPPHYWHIFSSENNGQRLIIA